MIAGLFVLTGKDYVALCKQVGHLEEAERADKCIDSMIEAVKKYGWDGEWYLRAYDFYGNKIGSHENEEGKIFIESQGFCTLAGIGLNEGLVGKALDSCKKYLDSEHGMVINWPAYTTYHVEMGELSSYPVGYKENGGIFCHNNPWVICGETVARRGNDAWEHYKKICPAWIKDQQLHKVEPYVCCQMVAGKEAARPVGSTTAIFKHVVNSDQSISNDHVNCVAQADATHLLMGTDNGLSVLDTQDSHWSNMTHGLVVLDICRAPNGKLLLATYGNGVCEVGADGKAHSIYNKANGTLQDDHIYSLLHDHSGNLWIGSLFGKLAEKMHSHREPQGKLGSAQTLTGFRYYNIDNVQCILELHDGRIVVGSSKGLYIIQKGKLKEFRYSVPNTAVVNRFILDLYEDNNRNLWIATDGGGVYVYNLMDSTPFDELRNQGSPTKKGKCFQITRENGLPSNSVSSIIKDKTGRIWFGTEKGLAFIYPKQPTKVIDVNYCNGVRTEYIRGAACNLESPQPMNKESTRKLPQQKMLWELLLLLLLLLL